MAGTGVEPVTFHFSGERSAVTGRRANQLRYGALTLSSLTAASGSSKNIARMLPRREIESRVLTENGCD